MVGKRKMNKALKDARAHYIMNIQTEEELNLLYDDNLTEFFRNETHWEEFIKL